MAENIQLPLKTSRLHLREFLPTDLAAIHAYASDAEVTRYLFHHPQNEADTQAYLAFLLSSQREQPRRIWDLAIIRNSDQQLIGSCDLTLRDERNADLGIILAKTAWGKGYGCEAVIAITEAGFTQLQLNLIIATCTIDNMRSMQLLSKAGFHCQTRLDAHHWAQGRWWSSYLYCAERNTWQVLPRGRS
jgi:RimJ/RimL family protein N-acetyltransferase